MTMRLGITTGTCAAAAAKAAALALRGETPAVVGVPLPGGGRIDVQIAEITLIARRHARAAVVKDAGDDPDVTGGMRVVADVELGGERVRFAAGDGVGTVRLPGLTLPVGEPAVNPAPREQIAHALAEVLGPEAGALVTVSIPGGAEVAAKTFNPRLGVRGGLSVLGTTGRVSPKSSEAWMRSLLPQLDVAVAAGYRRVWLVPGGLGESVAVESLGAPPRSVVQTANFFGEMLSACAPAGVTEAVLVGHVGKLAKIAAGVFDTHSRSGDARLETIAALAAAEGAPAPLVARLLDLPTAQAAVAVLAEAGLARTWDALADRAAARASALAGLPVECAVAGYDRVVLGRSAGLRTRGRHPGVALETAAAGLAVVGVGPGAEELIAPAAWREIRAADIVVGGTRVLAAFAPPHAERVELGAQLDIVFARVREALARGARVCVLASGDPGLFGVLATVRRLLPDTPVRVIPGISSVQLAAARLQVSWADAVVSSAHGREVRDVVDAVVTAERVFALADRDASPQAIASALCEAGHAGARMTVCERLGYADERITHAACEEIARGRFDGLSVVYVERGAPDAKEADHA